MLTAAALLVLGLILAGLAVWLARALTAFRADNSRQLESRTAEVDRRLQGLTETVDRRLAELDTKVDRRMEHASQQTNAIHKQLGDVGRATEQLAEQAKELGTAPAGAAPAEGERRVRRAPAGQPAADRLPADGVFAPAQFRAASGWTPSIVVDRLVPMDSKFPLDNFERIVERRTTNQRQQLEKLFARDVKGHIDAIAASTSVPTRAPTTSRSCTCRRRRSTTSSPAARPARCSSTRTPAELPVSPKTLRRVPADDRARAEGNPDRAARAGGHGLLRAAAEGFRSHSARTSTRRQAPRQRAERYVEAEKRLERFGTKLEQAAESPAELAAEAHELPRALDAA